MSRKVEIQCEACQRGEKTSKPPHSSIVGSMTVHFPSGQICAKDPDYQRIEEWRKEFLGPKADQP